MSANTTALPLCLLQLCYSYGQLRDDYAVAHYGFLPALENPPRLSLVDHRDFKDGEQYSHDTPPSEEEFVGETHGLAITCMKP